MPEQASEQSTHTTHLEVGLLALLLAVTMVSAYVVSANHQAFDVVSVHYASKGSKAWHTDQKGFRPVNLPFMEPGRFHVDFSSDQTHLNLDVYAQDCLMEAFLDGQRIMPRKKKCQFCYTFHPQPSKRCGTTPLTLDVTPGTTHRLAIRTQRGRSYDRPMLFSSTSILTFQWRSRFVAFVCFVFGVYRRRRYGRKLGVLARRAGDTCGNLGAFVFLIVCAVLARLLMAPVHQTGDIYQSALVYAEDFFHKSAQIMRTSRATISRPSMAENRICKPPGLYYQFVFLRWLFNFGPIFYLYLTAIPSLVGDLMLAYVIYMACNPYEIEP